VDRRGFCCTSCPCIHSPSSGALLRPGRGNKCSAYIGGVDMAFECVSLIDAYGGRIRSIEVKSQ
jgi:hypothetical protein